jgi:hypothetical protein
MFENTESLVLIYIDLVWIDKNEINIELSGKEKVFTNNVYFISDSVNKGVVFEEVSPFDVNIKTKIIYCT